MKKLLISLLALSLTLTALMLPVVAAEGSSSATGDAGIKFEEGDGPEIVTPPTGSGIKSTSLHFGTREQSPVLETYFSNDEDPAVGIDEEDRYAGLYLENDSSGINWKVLVSIGEFTMKEDGAPTLSNFVLKLHGEEEGGEYKIVGVHQPQARPTVPDDIILTAGSGTTPALQSNAASSVGTFGLNYFGELEVAAGTAHEGEAQATMTWSIWTGPENGDA